eukprot:m.44589 g.44589  ORF g.44589 m.44589 type:complete len:567 (+) comp10119_c0_seq2:214-1914(+)
MQPTREVKLEVFDVMHQVDELVATKRQEWEKQRSVLKAKLRKSDAERARLSAEYTEKAAEAVHLRSRVEIAEAMLESVRARNGNYMSHINIGSERIDGGLDRVKQLENDIKSLRQLNTSLMKNSVCQVCARRGKRGNQENGDPSDFLSAQRDATFSALEKALGEFDSKQQPSKTTLAETAIQTEASFLQKWMVNEDVSTQTNEVLVCSKSIQAEVITMNRATQSHHQVFDLECVLERDKRIKALEVKIQTANVSNKKIVEALRLSSRANTAIVKQSDEKIRKLEKAVHKYQHESVDAVSQCESMLKEIEARRTKQAELENRLNYAKTIQRDYKQMQLNCQAWLQDLSALQTQCQEANFKLVSLHRDYMKLEAKYKKLEHEKDMAIAAAKRDKKSHKSQGTQSVMLIGDKKEFLGGISRKTSQEDTSFSGTSSAPSHGKQVVLTANQNLQTSGSLINLTSTPYPKQKRMLRIDEMKGQKGVQNVIEKGVQVATSDRVDAETQMELPKHTPVELSISLHENETERDIQEVSRQFFEALSKQDQLIGSAIHTRASELVATLNKDVDDKE